MHVGGAMNKVHLADCMEFMRDLPENHYDLAIVDPPYAVGASDGNFGGRKGEGWKYGKLKHYTNYNIVPDKEYFDALFKISKAQVIWGANYYPQYLIHSGWIVWDKDNYGPLSDCELAFTSMTKLVKKYTYQWSGFLKGNDKKLYGDRIHPNQKPVALYKWLLQNYAKPGQTIFDSHVGSGSLRIACHDLGFNFEGCEIDKDYWEAQEDRYQNHIKQSELFDTEEIQGLVYKEGRCT